ncbi:hypothetical protein GCM10007304_37440 [Rhodococcoides trifolii]|uniref:Lipopolysaccharide assembly protein A domain-containing protein n=1 Tax=Rhodococcoides trifolii TaxID=908250 RepID=A0A917LG21_9NOCA|nr:lipopolysaccharide assembly protein LapA domain-containing protein [Rhodococcus trifolii]GGG20063.1 hypothetical protein GCM10007304_37440 [Rhodococcus trifolii]
MSTTTNRTPARKAGGFASKFSLLIALVLIVALVIFVLQNTVHQNINFIGWNFDLSVGVSLLGAAIVGAVIALILGAAIRLRRAVR